MNTLLRLIYSFFLINVHATTLDEFFKSFNRKSESRSQDFITNVKSFKHSDIDAFFYSRIPTFKKLFPDFTISTAPKPIILEGSTLEKLGLIINTKKTIVNNI